MHRSTIARARAVTFAVALVGALVARADETCQSPYMVKIAGQEDFVYVWTLGDTARGIGSDSVVTIGARPGTPEYGKVVARLEVGSINEAHHGGFTDDRRTLWLGGLDSSRIFLVDVASDPAKPRLVKTLENVPALTGGLVGPHTFYALPGRMLVAFRSNTDGGGETGLATFTNDGTFIKAWRMPEEAPYGYDVRVNANLGRMLTSSFTGRTNYDMDFQKLTADAVADVGAVLPVDISLAADDRTLYVTGFLSGTIMQWDVSDPFHPKKVHEVKLGKQANMVSQSWDGQRIYVTNSLLSAWDSDDAWWMKKLVRGPDGKIVLDPTFAVDFATLGRPHQMQLGARGF